MTGTTTAKANHNAVVTSVVIVLVMLAAFLFKDKLTEAPPISAGAFNTERAFARLERMLGDERPHPVDSDANDAVRERLISEIRALGYEPRVRDDFSCRSSIRWRSTGCARVRNVVFRMGPEGGNAILVASHYDSVPAGPGASDDGAGVAASLEIAYLIKERALSRPVIFLFTDGEELALNGAKSFVQNDPYAKDVTSVINVEARGVEGPAIMFETGAPNGREVRSFAQYAPRPVANSLATAIYKLMDNDTDLSEFLKLRPDALNFAYTGRVSFYHTPHDNLANLDKKSLSHIGTSAFGAMEGMLVAAPGQADPNLAFVDLLGRWMIILPYGICIGLIAAAFISGMAVYLRAGGGGGINAAFVPLLAAVLGGLIAYGAFFLLGALRSGDSFWASYPTPSQAVLYVSAITGAIVAFAVLGQKANPARLAAATWLWFTGLSAIAFWLVPGSAGLTAPLAGVFAVAALTTLALPRRAATVRAIAAVAAFIIWLPMLSFAESALGLDAGWLFAPLAALLVCLGLSLMPLQVARPNGRAVAAAFGTLLLAVIAAAIVPAHSPRAPVPMNIVQHRVVPAGETWWVLADSRSLTAPFAKAAPFEKRKVDGYDDAVFAAPAPDFEPIFRVIETSSTALVANQRRVTLKIESDAADAILVVIPEAAGLVALHMAGETLKTEAGKGDWVMRCWGRACRTITLEATVGSVPQDWDVYASRFGLDANAAPLVAARSASETPLKTGDLRREWQRPKL